MSVSNVVFNVDFQCRFLALIFTVDFQCHGFSKCRFPNKIFRMFFYYLITILPWLIELYFFFFFLPFPRFRYLFSNNFLLKIILYLFFFLFLSLMFFCFFLFFIISSQNRTYFTMITLGHHSRLIKVLTQLCY